MVSENLRYRPDIDGLRAIAVLAVIFFHAGLGVPGGFVGVDVFFVISGYLISGLILKDLEQDQFSLIDFWSRRVRRIFPALLVMVLFCLGIGWFFLLPADFNQLGQSVVAQTFLVSNVYFWQHSGYFDRLSETMPLLHTWSLAVEEQFYLFFPFFLIALKRLSWRGRLVVTLLVALISLFWCIHESHADATANFYLLPTRAWELLIGALALMLSASGGTPRWLREGVALAACGAIFYAIFYYNRGTRFPGTTALLPCGGAALLIWANTGATTLTGKILALPPLVFIGLISYSLYLWHWPILVFFKYWILRPLTIWQSGVLLGTSFVLAVVSWKWVETPFRRRTLCKGRIQILAFGGVASAVLVVLGLIIHEARGIPSRFPPRILAYANAAFDRGIQTEVLLDDVRKEKFIKLGDSQVTTPPRFLIWGDSHARMILPMLDALCREHGVQGLAATHSLQAPLLGYELPGKGEEEKAYSDAVMKFIQKRRIPEVILVAAWSSYQPQVPAEFRACLEQTLQQLRASGAKVWIMRQVPRPGVDVPRALASYAFFGGKDPRGPVFSLDDYYRNSRSQDEAFRGLAVPGVTILDPAPLFLDSQNRIRVVEDDKPLYFDQGHLSPAGAKKLHPLFVPLFEGAP